jgi:GntR family transcriptional repressor for pyruvate dehydrogenase complex
MARPAQPDVAWSSLPLRAAKRSDAVYDILEQLIATRQLLPGSRLPAERDLAAQLGVSRNSVREAVHELELKRLVERRSGRGTMVLDPQSSAHGALLSQLASDERDLLEIMDFRLTIEPPIAALAAERTTRGGLTRLARLVDEMTDESNPARIAELDYSFHAAIARATHNRLLVRLHEVSSEWLRQSRKEALQSHRRRAASLAGHQSIYEAIKAGDRAAAHAAMVDHIQQVRRIIEPRLARYGDAAGDAADGSR